MLKLIWQEKFRNSVRIYFHRRKKVGLLTKCNTAINQMKYPSAIY